jgi:hypothetical protein
VVSGVSRSVGSLTGTCDMGHGTFDIRHPRNQAPLLQCQMSRVPCPMSHVLVKLPTDPLTNLMLQVGELAA